MSLFNLRLLDLFSVTSKRILPRLFRFQSPVSSVILLHPPVGLPTGNKKDGGTVVHVKRTDSPVKGFLHFRVGVLLTVVVLTGIYYSYSLTSFQTRRTVPPSSPEDLGSMS